MGVNMNNNSEELILFFFYFKHVRELRGYSQQQVANMTGIKQQAYHRYETGSQTPSVLQAHKIAKALEVTIEELLQPKNQSVTQTDLKIETIKSLQKLGFKIRTLKDNKVRIQPFTQNTSVILCSENLIKAYTTAIKQAEPFLRTFISSEIQAITLDEINMQNGQ